MVAMPVHERGESPVCMHAAYTCKHEFTRALLHSSLDSKTLSDLDLQMRREAEALGHITLVRGSIQDGA